MHAPFARQVGSGLPDGGRGATIADLGSGAGHLIVELHKVCPRACIVGVDPSEEMLRMAQEYTAAAGLTDCEVEQGTAEDLPLASDSVDLLITQSSFHEWEDQAAGLAEVYRVLKPGGVVFIKDYNRAWLAPWKRAVLGRLHHLEMFRFDPQEVARLLRDAGFADVGTRAKGMQFVAQARKP